MTTALLALFGVLPLLSPLLSPLRTLRELPGRPAEAPQIIG
ncbi:hypothetical protein ACPC54_08955 [Kitasatospora sp. NPDC094028]